MHLLVTVHIVYNRCNTIPKSTNISKRHELEQRACRGTNAHRSLSLWSGPSSPCSSIIVITIVIKCVCRKLVADGWGESFALQKPQDAQFRKTGIMVIGTMTKGGSKRSQVAKGMMFEKCVAAGRMLFEKENTTGIQGQQGEHYFALTYPPL